MLTELAGRESFNWVTRCLLQEGLSPGLAETATIGHPANVVAASVCARRFLALEISLGLTSSGSKSVLLRTTQRCRVAISPTTKHSAVWACSPFGNPQKFLLSLLQASDLLLKLLWCLATPSRKSPL